jgi:hypothetical protein
VQHFTINQPGESLQSSVRVGTHMHAFAGRKVHWACMVQKTPRPHHALMATGQGTFHQHAFAQIGASKFNAFDWIHSKIIPLCAYFVSAV